MPYIQYFQKPIINYYLFWCQMLFCTYSLTIARIRYIQGRVGQMFICGYTMNLVDSIFNQLFTVYFVPIETFIRLHIIMIMLR